MSATLTNIFDPKPAIVENGTLWIDRAAGVTASVGFTAGTEAHQLAALHAWLEAARQLVADAIRAREAA